MVGQDLPGELLAVLRQRYQTNEHLVPYVERGQIVMEEPHQKLAIRLELDHIFKNFIL